MPSRRLNPLRTLAPILAVGGLLLTLPGCARASRQATHRPLDATGEVYAVSERPLAIDIDNRSGSVRVEIGKRSDEVKLVWWVHPSDRKGQFANLYTEDLPEWITMSPRQEGPNDVISIVVDPPAMESGKSPRVNLEVWAPRCNGLRVRNAGGIVLADGVDGAVDIDNGRPGIDGGRVLVRSSHPIDDPIHLSSTTGPVHLVAAPGSKGVVEIESGEHRAIFNSSHGRVIGIEKPTDSTWKGRWNGGMHPITLRSGTLDAVLIVNEKPEHYTVGRSLSW